MAYIEYKPVIPEDDLPPHMHLPVGTYTPCRVNAPYPGAHCNRAVGHNGPHAHYFASGSRDYLVEVWLTGDPRGLPQIDRSGIFKDQPATQAVASRCQSAPTASTYLSAAAPLYATEIEDWDLLEDATYDDAKKMPTLDTLPPVTRRKP